MKLKHTKGKWSIFCSRDKTYTIDTDKGTIGEIYGHEESDVYENLANAELIADAANTSNECDLLPSELLKQRDELLNALQEVVSIVKIHSKATKNNFAWAELEVAEEVINRVK